MALGLLAGCGRDRMTEVSLARASISAPQPPPILTTGAALLLTNNPGFTAKVEARSALRTSVGTLFGRGGRLLFIPEPEKVDRFTPEGRYSMIWDVSKNEGWLLSDALQGYAPVSMSSFGAATNVTGLDGAKGASGARVKVTVEMSDGRKPQLMVTLMSDEVLFPAQVECGEPMFTASFSKVSFKPPPASAFELPEGFAKFPSAEAMVDEMATRYRNYKRRVY